MGKENVPYKGFNTEKNNGLTDAQEVHYPDDFKKAYKAEKDQRQKNKTSNENG